jgi:hypothetical protein
MVGQTANIVAGGAGGVIGAAGLIAALMTGVDEAPITADEAANPTCTPTWVASASHLGATSTISIL